MKLINESLKRYAICLKMLSITDEQAKRKEFVMDELIPKNIIPEFISNDEIWKKIGAKFEELETPIKLPSTRLRYSDDEEIPHKFVKVLLPPNYKIEKCASCNRINIVYFDDIIKTINVCEEDYDF